MHQTQPGTLPHRVVEMLKSKPHGTELSTAMVCEALDTDSDGFTAYMRPAREHGLLHTRKAKPRHMFWMLGDGTRDPTLDEPTRGPDVRQVLVEAPAVPYTVPEFRALMWEGQLLATGMRVVKGVAVFTPEQVREIKRHTDWAAA